MPAGRLSAPQSRFNRLTLAAVIAAARYSGSDLLGQKNSPPHLPFQQSLGQSLHCGQARLASLSIPVLPRAGSINKPQLLHP